MIMQKINIVSIFLIIIGSTSAIYSMDYLHTLAEKELSKLSIDNNNYQQHTDEERTAIQQNHLTSEMAKNQANELKKNIYKMFDRLNKIGPGYTQNEISILSQQFNGLTSLELLRLATYTNKLNLEQVTLLLERNPSLITIQQNIQPESLPTNNLQLNNQETTNQTWTDFLHSGLDYSLNDILTIDNEAIQNEDDQSNEPDLCITQQITTQDITTNIEAEYLSCKICSDSKKKSIFLKDKLKEHIALHLNSNKRCSLCSKNITNNSQEHIDMHYGQFEKETSHYFVKPTNRQLSAYIEYQKRYLHTTNSTLNNEFVFCSKCSQSHRTSIFSKKDIKTHIDEQHILEDYCYLCSKNIPVNTIQVHIDMHYAQLENETSNYLFWATKKQVKDFYKNLKRKKNKQINIENPSKKPRIEENAHEEN